MDDREFLSRVFERFNATSAVETFPSPLDHKTPRAALECQAAFWMNEPNADTYRTALELVYLFHGHPKQTEVSGLIESLPDDSRERRAWVATAAAIEDWRRGHRWLDADARRVVLAA